MCPDNVRSVECDFYGVFPLISHRMINLKVQNKVQKVGIETGTDGEMHDLSLKLSPHWEVTTPTWVSQTHS